MTSSSVICLPSARYHADDGSSVAKTLDADVQLPMMVKTRAKIRWAPRITGTGSIAPENGPDRLRASSIVIHFTRRRSGRSSNPDCSRAFITQRCQSLRIRRDLFIDRAEAPVLRRAAASSGAIRGWVDFGRSQTYIRPSAHESPEQGHCRSGPSSASRSRFA